MDNLLGTAVGSLSTLRIRGFNVPWVHIPFSNNLVTVRLQLVDLGDKPRFIEFLRALQSAPELQDLKIISVIAFSPPPGSDEDPNEDEPGPKFLFPKLKLLLLEDLDFYTLQILLNGIVPGLHQTRLFLTSKSIRVYQPEEVYLEAGIQSQSYYNLLAPSKIDALLLNGHLDNEMWMEYTPLNSIIQSLPTLKTIMIVGWNLKTNAILALERPKVDPSDPYSRPFPSLDSLCIDGDIWDAEALSRVMASYPLQTMKLSGSVPILVGVYSTPNPDGAPTHWIELSKDDDNVRELRTILPHFQFWDDAFKGEDFRQNVWKLW